MALRATVLRSIFSGTARSARSPLSHPRTFATLSNLLDANAAAYPQQEIVRYERNNVKWSHGEVKTYSDAMVKGMQEMGLQRGDAILSWLPAESPEQHVLQFACAKAGFVLNCLSHSVTSSSAFETAIRETKAVAVFTPSAIVDTNYLSHVRETIPEVTNWNETLGLPFLSTKFPELKHCIHTGFDSERGLTNYKHIMTFNGEPADLAKEGDKLARDVDDNGKPGKFMTHKDISKAESWSVVCKIAQKEYTECNNRFNEGGLPY